MPPGVSLKASWSVMARRLQNILEQLKAMQIERNKYFFQRMYISSTSCRPLLPYRPCPQFISHPTPVSSSLNVVKNLKRTNKIVGFRIS
jgi:hypothetical protein